MWTNQIQDTLNSKKQGDSAFHARDFSTAIDCYTQVSQLEICEFVIQKKKFKTSKLQLFITSEYLSFITAKLMITLLMKYLLGCPPTFLFLD